MSICKTCGYDHRKQSPTKRCYQQQLGEAHKKIENLTHLTNFYSEGIETGATKIEQLRTDIAKSNLVNDFYIEGLDKSAEQIKKLKAALLGIARREDAKRKKGIGYDGEIYHIAVLYLSDEERKGAE